MDPHIKDTGFIPKKEWFAFFSHSGSEIVNLSNELGIIPKRIITNHTPGAEEIDPRLLDLKTELIYLGNRPSASDYERVLNRCDECMCTLHGWMRIVPKSVCNSYEMWNLHPGLITMYPELKGADPQKRVAEEKKKEYEWIGCVIHRVEPGVDEGKIGMTGKYRNLYYSEKRITERLHELALSMWVDFFAMCLSK
jgi:folate-dependent phosphoribosylglycinamide formyltransferase PurN